jgi:hypothetical protein
LDYSVNAIQQQYLFKVQPVSIDEKLNQHNYQQQQQQPLSGVNPFTSKSYNPLYPSVENSPTLGHSLDLLG